MKTKYFNVFTNLEIARKIKSLLVQLKWPTHKSSAYFHLRFSQVRKKLFRSILGQTKSIYLKLDVFKSSKELKLLTFPSVSSKEGLINLLI